MQDTIEIFCPHCGEPNEIFIDYSGGISQKYEEDCQVCCRPWEVRVELIEDTANVTVSKSNE
ncbi:CPXCG motif-containing cysteine-rich protein [candidate division KSB1 bacterium]|nr:CPXCG motif-containing cysteine-rich protein [candidate division KSB1 bacterium]MCH8021387.1 CPXCG motif-containing cysteine-rich protein [candidate division KSB1 bacterium]MCH8874538.1 CPXCG motif-containing cysteine-rich protein [candidate division KSB1 bacterium]MCH8980697.1 CPXCG motif-containing cysteine-rich protein [candidate division KSB1 bacterium]